MRLIMRLALGVLTASAVILAVPAESRARPLQDGIAAYARSDYARAIRILEPLALRGNAAAQTYVGFMYANGRGVPQDFVLAAEWYRRAAEQGNSDAQFMLGLMYDKGQGVPQDYIIAHKWTNLAAAGATGREREFFTRIRDAIASKLSPAEIRLAQSLARDWRPKRL